MSKNLKEHGFVSTIQQRTNHKDLQNCLFACFLSQEEPKKVIHALKDPSWIEAYAGRAFTIQVTKKFQTLWIYNEKRAIVIKVKTASIPIETSKASTKDVNGVEVDVQIYQVNQKVLHLYAVKRIFRYLKGQPKLSLWYPKDSPFDLVAYTDSDYAGASLDRKSTTGGCQFLGCRLISWQCKKQTVVANSITEAEYVAASSCCGQVLWIQNQLLDYGYNFMHTKIFIDNNRKAKKSVKLMMEKLFRMELKLMLCNTNHKWVKVKQIQLIHHTPTIIQPSTQLQKTQKPRKPKRKDTQVPQPSDPSENVVDYAVHKELGDSLVRAATTASSLEAEQDSDCQETMGDTIAQTRVLDLEKTKTTQANEIASLKRRVKKLKKKRSSRTHKLKRLYKVGLSARVESSGDEEDLGEDASKQGRRINAIDADEDITLVNIQDDADNEMFDVNVLNGEDVFVAGQNENVVEEVVDVAQVSTAAITVIITTEEITLAQALEALKTSKPKEHVKPMKKERSNQAWMKEAALKLLAEFVKEKRLARDKAEKEKEANIALIEEWDDIQAKIDADYQLAERMQAQEQEELSDA
ncbi:hypothetical protein Tco_0875495 [Tanacetum coccineum]|uniref:Uncharacterized protein n=1 Tax=Tanacetum coccineum TaxID=301880 RepID=A0ABQ5BRC7_9ASTR